MKQGNAGRAASTTPKSRHIFARFVVTARDEADVWALSHEAFRLWWASILWCRSKGNDGVVPQSIVPGLAPLRHSAKAAQELSAAGFYLPTLEGWAIRNYSEYQDTSEDIDRRHAASKAANDARWGNRTGVRNGSEPESTSESFQ